MSLLNPARIHAAAELRRQELLAEAERDRRSERAIRHYESVPDPSVRPAASNGTVSRAERPGLTLLSRLKTGWKTMTTSGA
jgi:hypothetical protein